MVISTFIDDPVIFFVIQLENPVITPEQMRSQILELLQLFSSEELQLKYERDVPHVDITAELVSMWFDDLYDPEDRQLPTCFKMHELSAINEFHRYYDERVDRLPTSNGTVRTWHACEPWQEVMEKAKRTLKQTVGPEPPQLMC